jgi:hypothetical protein
MKVVSYLGVIPAKNKNQEKVSILEKYIAGVKKIGDIGIMYNGNALQDCDVAVIQGWQHELGKSAAHLKLRKSIIDYQLLNKKFVCVADSNLFLYATLSNKPHHYLRYSFNGVFPNTGIYCDSIIDSSRWNQLSKDLNIKLENPKKTGKHILICLQRNGGWSMGKLDIVKWTNQVVDEIRKYTDRPIVLRTHPGDKSLNSYVNDLQKISNIEISNPDTSLQEDLKNAWCVVNHNSSSIVGPIILGYSAFITDPLKSQCKEVSHYGFDQIENPQEFDREKWLTRISMFHWKFSELEDGSCWKHMKNYCQ